MTKKYDAEDVHKVVNAVRDYYESKRTRDEDPSTIEIHNHLPARDDYSVSGENIAPRDEGADDDGVVARYPASYHAEIEDDELVIYSRAPESRTDLYDFKATHDHRPPRTLAEMNQFFAGYYPRRRSTAAR
jgi:hypothetical protein